jgi:PEP-CTERM motif
MVLRHSFAVGRARLRSILPNALITVMFVMLMAVPSRADEVTFLDLPDTLSVSTSSTRVSGSCNNNGGGTEQCIVTIDAPSGAFAGQASSPLLFIGEGDGTVSDILSTTPGNTSVQVTFLSDTNTQPLEFCADISGGCAVTEDGTVQFGQTIEWRDAFGALVATDTINFQSDTEAPPVPEPASVLLLGSGLLALAGRIRKRLA